MSEWVLAGTGSRSLEVAPAEVRGAVAGQVAVRLCRLLDDHGAGLVVMSGMAEGFDKLLAVTAIDLDVPLWCAIPNKGYGRYYWGRKSLTGRDQSDEWARIINRADRVTYVMEDVHRASGLYFNGVHSNFVRNQWMVEQGDDFVVWDPTSRGTAQCVGAIKKAGKWRDDMVISLDINVPEEDT